MSEGRRRKDGTTEGQGESSIDIKRYMTVKPVFPIRVVNNQNNNGA